MENDPVQALQCLDSIENPGRLRIADLANYYFLRWHATFAKAGELRGFVPLPQLAEYWEEQGELVKAGYTYLYNGLLVKPHLPSNRAAIYLDKATQLALKQQDSTLLFYSYYYRGKLLFRNHEIANGEKMFENALQCGRRHALADKPHYLFKVANCYLYAGDFKKAKEYYGMLKEYMCTGKDSLETVQMLYRKSHRIKNKAAKSYFADYLNETF